MPFRAGAASGSISGQNRRRLSGVIDYMKRYPYTCMEQMISVAVALRDENLWNGECQTFRLPGWRRVGQIFSACLYGCPVLTSYIIAIGHEAGYTIPDETRAKMETGLRNFIEGRFGGIHPWPQPIFHKETNSHRSVIQEWKGAGKVAQSISIEPNLWPTSAVIDWLNILRNDGYPNRLERGRRQSRLSGPASISRYGDGVSPRRQIACGG